MWRHPLRRDTYLANYERLRSNPRLRRAVVFDDFGPDMGNWFRNIGWMLSPSTRETFHLAPAERGLVAERAATGPGYWTFPQDFPARMPGLQARLGDRLRAEVAESDPVPPAP